MPRLAKAGKPMFVVQGARDPRKLVVSCVADMLQNDSEVNGLWSQWTQIKMQGREITAG